MESFVCTTCKVLKPRDQFHKNKNHSQNRAVRCIPCVAEYGAKWYRENREDHNKKARANRYRRSFGMSLEDYDILFEKQNGLCAICGVDDNYGGKRFSVDHDHKTGVVRGLLCDNCNTGIGMFKDNPSLMLNAIKYLT